MPWLPDLHSPEEDLAFFTAEVSSSHGWVVIDGEDLLGFALARDGWINQMFVDVGQQGRGVGSALLGEALRCLGPGARLWAFERNVPALGFYARHGFVEVRRTDGSGNDEKEPDVLLQWP